MEGILALLFPFRSSHGANLHLLRTNEFRVFQTYTGCCRHRKPLDVYMTLGPKEQGFLGTNCKFHVNAMSVYSFKQWTLKAFCALIKEAIFLYLDLQIYFSVKMYLF